MMHCILALTKESVLRTFLVWFVSVSEFIIHFFGSITHYYYRQFSSIYSVFY